MDFIIKRYANNELRTHCQTPAYRRKTQGDKSRERHLSRAGERFEELLRIDKLLRSTDSPLIPVVDIRPDGRVVEEMLCRSHLEKRRQRILDIAKKSQRRVKKHAAWGVRHPKKNFGAKARHKIIQFGAVIDQVFGATNAWEVTVTIPGSTAAAIAAVADYSGWITNRMTQVIRRSKIAAEVMWFFVWELQRRGALHMHWCIAHHDIEEVERLAYELEYQWFKCLWELKEKCGVDCFARKKGGTHRYNPERWQSNVQRIRKSVAAYFAKYAGKDAKNNKRLSRWKMRDLHYPARWWGSNKNVKDAIKKEFWEFRFEGLTKEECEKIEQSFWELADNWEWVCKYEYNFCINHPGLPIPLCSGNVKIAYGKPDTWQECSAGLKELVESRMCTGQAAIANEPVMSLIVADIKQRTELKNTEVKWELPPPRWTSPFTGEVFQTNSDIDLEVARIQLATEEKHMQVYGYAQRLDYLQRFEYEVGFADCNNPYLIEQQKIDSMIEYANSRMDYLQATEAANERLAAYVQYFSGLHTSQ